MKRRKDFLTPQLERFVALALERGATSAVSVDPSTVSTAPWVRMKCRFGCGGYGRTLCCPPYSPEPHEMRGILDSYSRAILLHKHVQRGRGEGDALNNLAVDLERELFFEGYYRAWATGCGPCTLCRTCDTSGPCRHPDRARPSMEACGIDVFATARGHGLPIRTLKGRAEERDFFALILVE